MQTPPYPKIPMEGRFVFLSTFNYLFDSLIDAPNSIEHPTRKLDIIAMYVGLNSIKTNVGNGAKIVHQMRTCTS